MPHKFGWNPNPFSFECGLRCSFYVRCADMCKIVKANNLNKNHVHTLWIKIDINNEWLIQNDPLDSIQSIISRNVLNVLVFPAIEFWRWLSLKFTMFFWLYRFCGEGWWNSFLNCNDILVTMNWGIEDESSWDEPGCHKMSNHQERKTMLF